MTNEYVHPERMQSIICYLGETLRVCVLQKPHWSRRTIQRVSQKPVAIFTHELPKIALKDG